MTAVFLSVVAVVSLGALYELYTAFQRIGVRPSLWTGTLALIALFVIAGMNAPALALLGTVNVYILVSLAQHLTKRDRTGSLVDWVFSLSGVLYVGFTMMHFVLLARIGGAVEMSWFEGVLDAVGADNNALGLAWLCVVLATTWATEVAVHISGRVAGTSTRPQERGPARIPAGAFAGLIAGTIVGGVSGSLFGVPVPLAVMFLTGGIIAIGALVGGLCESMIKRQLGGGNTSAAAQRRGGFLDRIAALRVTVPLTFYLATFLHWQT